MATSFKESTVMIFWTKHLLIDQE